MAAEPGEKATSRLALLVQNRVGYLNLCALLSRGWLENAASGHAVIEWSWLRECAEGLIVLSGADAGGLQPALDVERDGGGREREEPVARRAFQLLAPEEDVREAHAPKPTRRRGPSRGRL